MSKRKLRDNQISSPSKVHRYYRYITDSCNVKHSRPSVKLEKSDRKTVEIFKEDVGGVQVFRCPFCDEEPQTSDIKFRKHLKIQHPTEKTLLKYSKKVSQNENFNAVELKDVEKLYKLVDPEYKSGNQTDLYLNPSENSQTVDVQAKRVKDISSSPMLVIDQDSVEAVVIPEPRKRPEKVSRGRPLSENARKVQKIVENCFANSSYLNSVPVDTRPETRCSICCTIIDGENGSSGGDIFQWFEDNMLQSVITLLENITGSVPGSVVCQSCEKIGSDIVKTKQAITKLHRRLAQAVSKLTDYATLGQKILEEDLVDGGLSEAIPDLDQPNCLVVKVLEDPRLDISTLERDTSGLAKYAGQILSEETEQQQDDGSTPLELDEDTDEDHCLYLSQQEWANAGLFVYKEVVYIPRDLIGGMAIGSKGKRWLFSQALSEDLLRKYNCLDCPQSFDNLSDLIDHSEEHASQVVENLNTNNESLEGAYAREEPGGSELGENFLRNKFPQGLDESNLKESDKYRIELRSYMHKEQFKDCNSEVPSLDKPFQCKECNKTFERAHDLWGHHASFRGPAFKCNFQDCQEVFLRLPDFAVHYSAHGGVDLVVPESSAEKKTVNITCPVCQTVVPGLYKLQRHKMKHDPELKYKCPACPKQFVKANTLRMHITNVHKAEKFHSSPKLEKNSGGLVVEASLACDVCGEVFGSEGELRSHKEVEHVIRSCPECEERLEEKTSLLQHFNVRHPGEEQRFQCSDCPPHTGPRLLSLNGARRHYRQTHTARSYICWVCKETHTTEADLLKHLSDSHPEVVGSAEEQEVGPVACLHCGSLFSSHMERVAHTRLTHLLESIDITTTDLDEVTMVGGHVIEFGAGTQQIVALHTIP